MRNPTTARVFLTYNDFQLRQSELPPRLREFAVLRVGHSWRSAFFPGSESTAARNGPRICYQDGPDVQGNRCIGDVRTDVGALVVFLLSTDATFITAQPIHVDGELLPFFDAVGFRERAHRVHADVVLAPFRGERPWTARGWLPLPRRSCPN